MLRLWDSFFADTDRYDFLICFCIAMVTYKRSEILRGDFPDNLNLLQHYPSTDLHILLDLAQKIRDDRKTSRAHTYSPTSGKMDIKNKAMEIVGIAEKYFSQRILK